MLIYALIGSALLYAAIVKAFGMFKLSTVFAGVATAVGYFAFYLLFTLPPRIGSGIPLLQTIEVSDIVTLLLQAIVGVWVFYNLRKNEDSIESWSLWIIIGIIVLFLAIPFAVSKVL